MILQSFKNNTLGNTQIGNNIVTNANNDNMIYILNQFNSMNIDKIDLSDSDSSELLFNMTSILKKIIYAFGGNKIDFTIDLNITSKDIEYNKNFIYFSPFISNTGGNLIIDWGDGSEVKTYTFSDIIFHEYTTAKIYKITFKTTSKVYLPDFNLNMHRQTSGVYVDNEYDNSLIYKQSSNTLIDAIDSSNNHFIQDLDNDVISNSSYSNTPTNVKFGSTVREIAEYAFKGNTKLYQINFDKSSSISEFELKISKEAFANCISLVGNIFIPENCTLIGDDAFANCYNIYSITIPKSCISIGKGAFYNMKSLKYLIFKGRSLSEAQQFIEENTINDKLVWFTKNNIDIIEYDKSLDMALYDEYEEYIKTLPKEKPILYKTQTFRKHILADKIQKYDFTQEKFKYLKYLSNTTPIGIDSKNLYYSSTIVNTFVESESENKILLRLGGDGSECYSKFSCEDGVIENACEDANVCDEDSSKKCLLANENSCGSGDDTDTGNVCSGANENRCVSSNQNSCGSDDNDQGNSCLGQNSNSCKKSVSNTCNSEGSGENICNGKNSKSCAGSQKNSCENDNKCNGESSNSCIPEDSKSCGWFSNTDTNTESEKNENSSSANGLKSYDEWKKDSNNSTTFWLW